MVGVEARLNCYLAFGALLERYVITSVEMQLIEVVIGTLPLSQLTLAADRVGFVHAQLACVVERLHVQQERLNCQSLVLQAELTEVGLSSMFESHMLHIFCP